MGCTGRADGCASLGAWPGTEATYTCVPRHAGLGSAKFFSWTLLSAAPSVVRYMKAYGVSVEGRMGLDGGSLHGA